MELERVYQFRNDEIEIGVTLTVAVRRHIDRHTVDPGSEIRAVVEIEAAQKILVSLAATRVLCRDHAGHGFEQLGHFEHRPHEQIRSSDGALARCIGRPEQLEPASENDNFLHRRQPALHRRTGRGLRLREWYRT